MSQVILSEKHQKLMVPLDPRVKSIVHNAQEVQWRDGRWLAVPHGLEETKLLNNMGYKIPSPILSYYDWAGQTPFDTQRKTAAMLVANRRAYVLNSIGTGKTCSTLFAYDFLRKSGLVHKMLVIAPLSTLTQVWEREVFMRFHHLESCALFGTKKKRLELLEKSDADIFIINHDGVKVIQKELLDYGFDVVALDELAVYRNARTGRWKMAKPIVDAALYAWGLTGKPTPNDPTDAWAQVRMLTPERVVYSAKKFKEQTMRQVSTFRWIPRPDANDIVFDAMQPAVRYTREESFDMPPTTIGYRDVAMRPEQEKLYKRMVNTFAVQVRNREITAANEGVKVSKLLQIASGFIYDADGNRSIINSNPRFKLLLELIEEADAKCIVFTPFKFSVTMLEAVLSKYHSVAAVTGDTPKAQRDKVFNEFQNSTTPEVIVAHPGCMAHGLTLTKADTVIWFAPIWSTETYEQACGRITRAGQDKHTHILHIVGSPIEKKIYKRLENRQKCQGLLLDMFKEEAS